MARIQKIESDSSFNLSNVLEGKILTYKTFENGRVVHKAKLHDGSVVEITPDLSPLQAAIDTKITAPTFGTAGQFLQKTSDSTQWVDINLNNYYTKSDIDGLIQDISDSLYYLNGKFDNYYTKQQVNALIEGLPSDSFDQSLINRVTALQSHQYVGQGAVKVTQESSSTLFSLTVDSNTFSNTPSGLSSLLTIKQISNSITGFAATYQLQGADGNPIGDKINIPRGGGYQIGKGLKVTDTQLFLQSDSNTDTNKFLSIGSDTIGLKGITEAINEAVSSYTQLPPIGFPGQFLQKTSDSLQWAFVDLSNYYTIAEVDALWSGSNSTTSFITVTEVTNNKIYLQGLQIPIGIQTSQGNYYPIEKGSLQIGSDSVLISVAPYLVYDNTSTFQAPWVVWMGSSAGSDPDTVYTKVQVNTLLRQKYDVSAASLLQQLTYSNAYSILELQSAKQDVSDAQETEAELRGLISQKFSLPEGGTTGQFLQKTSDSTQWASVDLSAYYTTFQIDGFISALSNSIESVKIQLTQKLDVPPAGLPGDVLMLYSDSYGWNSLPLREVSDSSVGTIVLDRAHYGRWVLTGTGNISLSASNWDDGSRGQVIVDTSKQVISIPADWVVPDALWDAWTDTPGVYCLQMRKQGGIVYAHALVPFSAYQDSSQQIPVNLSARLQAVQQAVDYLSDSLSSLQARVTTVQGKVDALVDDQWVQIYPSPDMDIDPQNGSRQKVYPWSEDMSLTAPTLSYTYPKLTLQIAKDPYSSFTLGGVTIQLTQTVLISWYYDGSTTRRLPILFMGD